MLLRFIPLRQSWAAAREVEAARPTFHKKETYADRRLGRVERRKAAPKKALRKRRRLLKATLGHRLKPTARSKPTAWSLTGSRTCSRCTPRRKAPRRCATRWRKCFPFRRPACE